MKDPEIPVINIDEIHEEEGKKLGSVVAENTGSKLEQAIPAINQTPKVELQKHPSGIKQLPELPKNVGPKPQQVAPDVAENKPNLIASLERARDMVGEEINHTQVEMMGNVDHNLGMHVNSGKEGLTPFQKRVAQKAGKV